MHFEPRLWIFTKGLRLRIGWAVLIGLLAVGFGVVRLGLLGWGAWGGSRGFWRAAGR